MNKVFILMVSVACSCIHASASAQTATEKAEKRLANLLTPGVGVAGVTVTTEPRVWKASAVVDDIATPVKPFTGAIVRLPQLPSKAVKPRSAPEGLPLASYQDKTPKPMDVMLPTEALIWLPSDDVHTPLAIPVLGEQLKDRASLGDPAVEASLNAAMKALTPARDRPVPFAPLNLPDPFENIRAGQLRNPPEENPVPPVIPLRKPQ